MVFITVDQCCHYQGFLLSLSLSLSLHGTGPCWVSLSFFLSPASLRHKEAPVEERTILLVEVILHNDLLLAPLVTRNPNLQVVITDALNVCSQHLFGRPLRINGILEMQFDHAHFDLLPLVIFSRVSLSGIYTKHSVGAKTFVPPIVISCTP